MNSMRSALLLWCLECYHIFAAGNKRLRKKVRSTFFFLQSLLLLILSLSSLFPMHLCYVPHQTLIIAGFELTLYQCRLNYCRIFRFIGLDLIMHHDEADSLLLKDVSFRSPVKAKQGYIKNIDIVYFKRPDTFMGCVEYHREGLNNSTDDC